MTTERNRALRIAYARARAGDESTARRWTEVAATFAAPAPRQLEHVERLIRESGPLIHPGQLQLVQ